jgi:hypothetical protein
MGGGSATAISPNGRLLAVGTGAPGVQVIDLRRMEEVAYVKLGGIGWVTHLFWERGLLFAVVDGDQAAMVALVDAVGWDVLRRERLTGTVLDAAVGSHQGTGQVVLLTAPRRHIGAVGITVVGGKGGDSVVVSSISGGTRTENGEDGYQARQVMPGLAIDELGHRALIISAGRKVAEVSLGNLAVEYHAISEPVSIFGRLRNWLEPAAEAKLLEGPQRKAAWLGNGLLAVTGVDYTMMSRSNGEAVQPAGLSLIDTRTWAIRKIDDEASDFARFENTLLAYGVTDWTASPEPTGFGIVGYDFAGKELFRALGETGVSWVEAVGGLAYVTLNEKHYAVVDGATGHVFARTRTKKPLSLVTN